MADIAEAAGVGRATLYRYFPSRGVLLQALTEAAIKEVKHALEDGGLDTAPFPSALAGLTRAFVALSVKYVALAREEKMSEGNTLDRDVRSRLATLFGRGVAERALRDDLPRDALVELYTGLLQSAMLLTMRRELNVEQASEAVISVFLTGAAISGGGATDA